MLAAVSTVLLTAAPASASSGDSTVRFVHAVPGVGDATVTVNGEQIGTAGFGEASEQTTVAAGKASFEVTAAGGVDLTAEQDLAPGKSYLAVAMKTDKAAEIRFFEDRAAKAGVARLRMIHAAPELGDANLVLDDKVVAKDAAYTDATDYLQLEPGDYRVTVKSPKTDETVVAGTASLAAGTSDTALVIGSQGEQAKIMLVQDDVAAPGTAPETGLGGLARTEGSGPDLPLAGLAALAAGLLGLAVRALMGGHHPPFSRRG
jgi:hypothetical protein